MDSLSMTMEQLLLQQTEIIEKLIELNKEIIKELAQYKSIEAEEERLQKIERLWKNPQSLFFKGVL